MSVGAEARPWGTVAFGDEPLVVSVPHAGTALTPEVEAALHPDALTLPDTDWFVDRLYAFAVDLGASMQVARMSRYVVDPNREPGGAPLYPGAPHLGVCPRERFDGTSLYRSGMEPTAAEEAARVAAWWRPYHDHLAATVDALRARWARVVVFDAHSIRGEVPHLFDGRLPDLNLGTFAGRAADPELSDRVFSLLQAAAPWTAVRDGRFKGGWITRAYGRPRGGVSALQLELAQRTYLDEEQPPCWDLVRAAPLMALLRQVLSAALAWAREGGEAPAGGEPLRAGGDPFPESE